SPFSCVTEMLGSSTNFEKNSKQGARSCPDWRSASRNSGLKPRTKTTKALATGGKCDVDNLKTCTDRTSGEARPGARSRRPSHPRRVRAQVRGDAGPEESRADRRGRLHAISRSSPSPQPPKRSPVHLAGSI